jgi:hypothetical protein
MANLSELFSLLDGGSALTHTQVNLAGCELFGDQAPDSWYNHKDVDIISGFYSKSGVNLSLLCENARLLFDLSIDAFDAFVHAWMSETCIEASIVGFGRKVLLAAKNAACANVDLQRRAAGIAASDRGDPDSVAVLKAAFKARYEVHRLQGLLRFSRDGSGIYIARCSPDCFVLPAFGEYFSLRFGGTPWAIVDEKRQISLCGVDEGVKFCDTALNAAEGGEWENLWRHYHQTINNESRKNLSLQRRLMPKRYWKYLPEV